MVVFSFEHWLSWNHVSFVWFGTTISFFIYNIPVKVNTCSVNQSAILDLRYVLKIDSFFLLQHIKHFSPKSVLLVLHSFKHYLPASWAWPKVSWMTKPQICMTHDVLIYPCSKAKEKEELGRPNGIMGCVDWSPDSLPVACLRIARFRLCTQFVNCVIQAVHSKFPRFY